LRDIDDHRGQRAENGQTDATGQDERVPDTSDSFLPAREILRRASGLHIT